MTHDEKVKKASDLIDVVFGDTTVSREKTLESLIIIKGNIEMMIEATSSDKTKQTDRGRSVPWPEST